MNEEPDDTSIAARRPYRIPKGSERLLDPGNGATPALSAQSRTVAEKRRVEAAALKVSSAQRAVQDAGNGAAAAGPEAHIQSPASSSSPAVASRSRSPTKRNAGDASLGSESDDAYVSQRAKGKSRDVVEISSSSEEEQDDNIVEAAPLKRRGWCLLSFYLFIMCTHSHHILSCSQEASQTARSFRRSHSNRFRRYSIRY